MRASDLAVCSHVHRHLSPDLQRRTMADRGFTLIEVLIAMAITAFVAIVAYTGLSTVIGGVESARAEADRLHEVTRAVRILSRDIRQFTNRPVYDEFGTRASALEGGLLAREPLALTRAGWHNSVDVPRSTLQRVGYFLDGDQLIRASYPVLDRTGAIEPREVVMLNDVEDFEVRFLASTNLLRVDRGVDIDKRLWQDSWIADVSQPGSVVEPPVAIEVRLQVEGWGDIERVYVLPPL